MKVWAGLCSFKAPEKNVFLPFTASPGSWIPERVVSSHLQTSNGRRVFSWRVPLALPPLLHLQGPTWLYRGHLGNPGSRPRLSLRWLANSIPAATVILACRATTYSQVWGIRMRASLRRGVLPTIESISVPPLTPGANMILFNVSIKW